MSDETVLAKAEALAESFEGFVNHPYQDPVGVWTIGFGSTRDLAGNPVCATTPCVTLTEARRIAMRDLQGSLRSVQGGVKVPLTDDEAAALADFVYNLGVGNFRSSTLLRKLNAGDYAGAACEFDRWDQAGGRVLAGLLRRRQAECALFTTAPQKPVEAPSAPPVQARVSVPVATQGSILGWLSGMFGR